MNVLHLFHGAGGGLLAEQLLGHSCCCAVEIEADCVRMLQQRQRDGVLPWFPIANDVRYFDGRPWRGIAQVVAGGFPCQDISVAGKGAGIGGDRSGLWSHFARIIGEVQPQYVFVENSPALLSARKTTGILTEMVDSLFGRTRHREIIDLRIRQPDAYRVLGDLAAMGFDAEWGVVSAEDAIWLGGTPAVDHLRERIWIVARAIHWYSNHMHDRTKQEV